MCLKNRKEKATEAEAGKREEWLGSLERVVGDRSCRDSGLTKRFRFNSNSTGSIRKFLGKESIIKLLKFLKDYSACY